MGIIAILSQGRKKVSLTDSPYKIDLGYVPPSPESIPLLATGTAANRSGAVKRGETPQSRQLQFTITVSGSSEAQCRMSATPFLALLQAAGDETNPVCFEFKGNDDVPFEPLWGQYGANSRYIIAHLNTVNVWPEYGNGMLRNARVKYQVSCLVKPHYLGLRQRLGRAAGGLFEDNITTADGLSRGITISQTEVNKMTNPMFGHSTWNTNWSAGAGITATENTDEDFIIFGGSSAKLTATGSSSRTFSQSIDVGNTGGYTLSCYAKLKDGSAVSSSSLSLLYGATSLTETYTAVGNGWYRVAASFTGIASAQSVGVVVVEDYTVYIDMIQIEQNGFATSPFYGDMMGVAWSGTAHESTSTRTDAVLSYPSSDLLNIAEGTIRIVWRANRDSTDYSSTGYFCQASTTGMRVTYNSTGTDFRFTDGTNTIDGAADTFSTNEIIVLHAVYSPTGLVLYKNGVSVASGASYTPAAFSGRLYIGSDSATGAFMSGVYLGFATYDRAMTSAQALADYTNISAQVNGGDGLGQQLEPLPWLWTKDGDDVVDNCNDSSRDNFAVCGGIPGNVPAETWYNLEASVPLTTCESLWLSLLDVDFFVDPGDVAYVEFDGTSDSGSSGGEYQGATWSTTYVEYLISTSSLPGVIKRQLLGRSYQALVRLYDAGTDLDLKGRDESSDIVLTEANYLPDGSSAFRLHAAPPMTVTASEFSQFGYDYIALSFGVYIGRTTGSTAGRIDYIQFMYRPFIRVKSSATVVNAQVFLRGRLAQEYPSGNGLAGKFVTLGDEVDLRPNKVNILMSVWVITPLIH